MQQANRIIWDVLEEVERKLEPGMTTMDVDRMAEDMIRSAGAKAAFKGYPHPGDGSPFPGTVCVSLNDEIVHGVPSEKTVLSEGDILSVDCGVVYKGYYGDSARTFPVGDISEESRRLLDVTRESLKKGIAQAKVGNRVSDIGHAVQTHVEGHGFSVVREFVGHGIGARLHEDPQVPNFGAPGRRERLQAGMVLAIEPMVNAGGPDVLLSASDGWTARTRDGSRSAHFEMCVAVTEDGPRILGQLSGSNGG
ncbi:methionine aminopeptidase [Acidobacteria bacterium Mor1]|nr:methionine aminopeptidase [Acidobacteria bacterium Mor1]